MTGVKWQYDGTYQIEETMTTDSRNERGSPPRSFNNSTLESDEITIIPAEIGVRHIIFPFSLEPRTIFTTGNLQRRYQIRRTPPPSSIRVNNSVNYSTIPIEQRERYHQYTENDGASFSEGITIVPAVSNDYVNLSTAAVSIQNGMTNDNRDFSQADILSPPTTSNVYNGESTSSNAANGTESRISSLSLHASSVESSVMTEWVSIPGGNGSFSGSRDQNDFLEMLPSLSMSRNIHNVQTARSPPLGLHVDGIGENASRGEVRSDVSQSEVSAQEKTCDEDSELESLTSSFLGELNRMRQGHTIDDECRDDTGYSNSPLEPWYTNLETDLDWEVFREHARTILNALENSDDVNKESEEIRLARLILEEENVYWKTTANDETDDGVAPDGASITNSLRHQRRWKLAGDLALTVAAAAVASISYSVLSKRKT